MIKNFEPRLYQQTILATAVKKNTLVVLPTGMGKTNIFLMLAAQRLRQYPDSKILLIGPTRPLIDQYFAVFKSNFEIEENEMAIFTGNVSPEKREELWKKSKIIFSTPQGLENDIISNKIKLEEVSLLGVDEAHRAVGDYAYVFVAKQYQKKARYPRIIGMTASPGSDIERISEVCKNLFIEDIEVRTEEDPDIKQYVQEINIEWVNVELTPPFIEVQKYLKDFLKSRLEKLKTMGMLHNADVDFVNKTDILSLQAQLRGRAASGEKDYEILGSISILSEIMKVQHALELLETQGIVSAHSYLEKLNHEGYISTTKSAKNIVKDLNFRSALIKTEKLYQEKVEHPKLIELQKIIEKEIKASSKILVFNQYRDNAADIIEKLNRIAGVKANIFVGQQKKGETGLSQKKQREILDKFKEGEFNILVATSVAEEGLDVPRVDLVIFFEPIPSAIRYIQRKGRTGRQEKGRVIILMTKNTRDVGYKWSAHHKEKRMYRTLKTLKERLGSVLNPASKGESLEKFVPEENKVKIYADYREKGSGVIKELIDMNTMLKLESLETADYVLSYRVAVEFKTVEDFVNSLIDGRLLTQIKELKQNFERPLLMIEGTEDIYSVRNVHQNAIRGLIATINVSFGVPIIYTRTQKESAAFLYLIAKREQEETKRDFSLHGEKRKMSLKEWQEYIVGALPNIGGNLAKELLKEFGSVKNVFNASEEELKKVEKIGEKKASDLRKVVDSDYEKER